jgi:hypothetical protein
MKLVCSPIWTKESTDVLNIELAPVIEIPMTFWIIAKDKATNIEEMKSEIKDEIGNR